LNGTCASGNCNMTFSPDTFFGGNAVIEQKRANWELVGSEAFDVYDEGLDGTFGSVDDKVFLRPGLFNP
jgi:hypothetical protein